MAENNGPSQKRNSVRKPGEGSRRTEPGRDRYRGAVEDDFGFYEEDSRAYGAYGDEPHPSREAAPRSATGSSARHPSERAELPPAGSGIRRPGGAQKAAYEAKRREKDERERRREQSYRNMRKSRFSRSGNAALIIVLLVVLLSIGVFSAFLSYTYLVDRYENPITAESVLLDEATTIPFKIERGAQTEEIADALKEQGIIRNRFLFRLLSKFNGYDGTWTSGVHYISGGLTYDEVMVILSAEPETVTVTFPEGFTTIQIAERLDSSGVVKKEAFLEAVNSIDLSSYSFVPQEKGARDYRLDGFLFPDTYNFEIDSSCETVIYKMLNRFNDIFKPEYYERAGRLGLSVSDVVTIASLVEKEAKVSSERELIARVYYNRLQSENLRMLQCDATVQYFVRRRTGETPTVITAEMLAIDDPYNTYLYEGLTPGPICSPSSASIRAVIEMNPHDYYYYVLKKDGNGTHVFSRTLEEHNAAVEANR